MLNEKEIKQIESIIGYSFKNKTFLQVAFTHSSVANSQGIKSNERLEFLGDSILNFVTTEYLFSHFTEAEGDLSKAKAFLVSSKNLSSFILQNNLINFLHCKTFNPNKSENVMGDLFEAVLGAIYMDCQNIDVCKKYIIDKLKYDKQNLQLISEEMADYKTKLQELLQQKSNNKIEYKIIEKTGVAHQPCFKIGFILNGEVIATAEDTNKKSAENKAAKVAYEKLIK